MKPVEKSLVFFKVFDLAFFAPGMLLLVTGWWFAKDHPTLQKAELTSIEVAFAIFVVIILVYTLGLINFSLTWLIFGGYRWFIKWIRDFGKSPGEISDQKDNQSPSLLLHLKKETQDELLLYFWYLRAVCLGLACALLISSVLIVIFWDDELRFWTAAMGLLATTLLAIQGLTYNKSLDQNLESMAKAFQDDLGSNQNQTASPANKEQPISKA